jgi:SAM-dependent methyltransferase
MLPKPSHLSGKYGAWFKDPLMVASYPARPAYPAAVLELVASLAVDVPRAVLDVGCGTGELARRLAPQVDRVDAVDFSAGMIELGRRLPGGDAPNLHWTCAAVEDVPLTPPYALITAGDSLHWMDWEIVMARFASVLSPRGVLAVAERSLDGSALLREQLRPLYAHYSLARGYRPFDLADDLEERGLFTRLGQQSCGPEPWFPTVDEYLDCRHSQRSFSRTQMGSSAVAAFDAAVRETLDRCIREGQIAQHDARLGLSVEARVFWGTPHAL